jgi:hypothetical protein
MQISSAPANLANFLLATTGLSANVGTNLPLAQIVRDGATSFPRTDVLNGILDIRVLGARPGKFYRLEWYGNGVVLGGNPNYEMLFSEYDAGSYASLSTASATQIIGLGNIPATSIDTSTPIITRVFNRPSQGMSFIVTYDQTKFTPGTSVALNLPVGTYCYSWVIDPSRYVITQGSPASNMPLAYGLDGGILTFAMQLSAAYDIKILFEPAGASGLYQFGDIFVAPHSGGPPRLTGPAWTQVGYVGTDWLGPYVMSAVNNPDPTQASRAGYFTGGSHGTNNLETGGSPTAKNIAISVQIDGTPMNMTDVAAGTAREIVIALTNQIQANNTLRYVLQESYLLKITPGACEVAYRNIALEQVKISLHYGMQIVGGGFQNSVHFVGGQQAGRVAATANVNSGASSSYPTIPWISMRGNYGDVAMWLDPSFGLTPSRPIDSTQPAALFAYYGAGLSNKAYEVMVNSSAGYTINQGGGYSFRGGYVWGANLSSDANIDCSYRYLDATKYKYGVTFNAAATANVSLAPQDRNRPLTYVNGTGESFALADVTAVTASQYGAVTAIVGP